MKWNGRESNPCTEYRLPELHLVYRVFWQDLPRVYRNELKSRLNQFALLKERGYRFGLQTKLLSQGKDGAFHGLDTFWSLHRYGLKCAKFL